MTGSREKVLVGVFAIVAVALLGLAALAFQQRGAALDRQQEAEGQLASTEDEAAQLDQELGAPQAELEGLEAQIAAMRQLFTPETLEAVTTVQADLAEAACAQARAATRAGTALPTGAQAVQYAAATGPQSQQSLQGLSEEWAQLVDPTTIQSQIDGCAADERAAIEAEAAAAAAQAAAEAEAERLDGEPPCDPSQLTVNSPERGTYCVND